MFLTLDLVNELIFFFLVCVVVSNVNVLILVLKIQVAKIMAILKS